MHNFVKHEYLDGDGGVIVTEVTKDFITVNSFHYLSASWLQWLLDNEWEFLNTWCGTSGPKLEPRMTVYTNFQRKVQ
ncbi:hypothetical protein PHABIO_284 [Pseudomonas phage Phabio]|uniref:Uncharacterized protein n=1 Tax=Pseudomonas phage Phabio TaxID=2006668 RepID=A0A1Y0SWP0_9CAUD|nr:hypothetical protein MZD05_gp284 [Pseudomonas phage Phabio]ARV76915.1 hypothetical protein PHABIO_284 [Pseudomonas phage Phabio]